jgi:hypothetical protein
MRSGREVRRGVGKAGVAVGATLALVALPLLLGPISGVSSRPRARAAGGLVRRSVSKRVVDESNGNPDGRTFASVDCPDSHPKVTGGGISIGGNNPDLEVAATNPQLNASGRDPDGWAGGANDDTGHDSSMDVTVICGKGRFNYPDDVERGTPGTVVQDHAGCPRGSHLSGGGVFAFGDHSNEVASTRPLDGNDPDSKPDDLWLGAASAGGIIVKAVCAKTGRYKYVHTARLGLADGTQQTATAHCPARTEVSGGGVDISGQDDGLEVGDSFPSRNGWVGRAINDETGQRQTMQVFAICKV